MNETSLARVVGHVKRYGARIVDADVRNFFEPAGEVYQGVSISFLPQQEEPMGEEEYSKFVRGVVPLEPRPYFLGEPNLKGLFPSYGTAIFLEYFSGDENILLSHYEQPLQILEGIKWVRARKRFVVEKGLLADISPEEELPLKRIHREICLKPYPSIQHMPRRRGVIANLVGLRQGIPICSQ